MPLGAIQIISHTFWPIVDPSLPHVSFGDTGSDPPHPRVTRQFSFYKKHSFLNTFAVKFSFKMD